MIYSVLQLIEKDTKIFYKIIQQMIEVRQDEAVSFEESFHIKSNDCECQ